jgi:hypothetical protein
MDRPRELAAMLARNRQFVIEHLGAGTSLTEDLTAG